MIDHKKEKLIPFEECGELLPGNPSRCTLYRWILKGTRGVKLETMVCGSKRFVSVEAVERFIAAQNAGSSPAFTKTASQRRRQSEAARAELERIGV